MVFVEYNIQWRFIWDVFIETHVHNKNAESTLNLWSKELNQEQKEIIVVYQQSMMTLLEKILNTGVGNIFDASKEYQLINSNNFENIHY